MNSRFALAAALLSMPCVWPDDKDVIVVTLERHAQDRWTALDSKTVLDSGDRVRFRFRGSQPGWLYVYYTGSDGKSDWLEKEGQLTVKEQEYEVPRGSSYTVSGPPGFDTVYWILSPKPIPAEALIPASAKRNVSNTMRPRCRDGQPEDTKAACLDNRAGPAGLRARELKLDKAPSGAAAGTNDRNVGVMVYEFRIAHR